MKLKTMITLALLTMSMKSFASSTVTLSSGFWLSPGQTKSVSVHHGYVETITVQAEGQYQDSMVEVWANGKPKGSLYVPGRDPNYVVTIRESISSLEFRSAAGGSVHIIQVVGMGVQGSSHEYRPSLGSGYNSNEATAVASAVKSLVNEMKKSLTPKQQDQYIMPIRKSATELYAIASSNSQYGVKVHQALTKLLNQLNNAQAVLDSQLETDNGEDVVTDITVVKERIVKMLY